MSELIIQAQTMSSVVIAELTGKRHSHVVRDIDNLLKTLSPELGLGFKSSSYKDVSGKANRAYELDKDSATCLVSGYDANSRMKIIKRWQELESQAKPPSTLNPTNMSRLQLLEMAMQAEQERLALEHKVEEMQPKVEALDRIASANGSLCITDTAKSLQMKPSVLFKWLNEQGWIYRRVGGTAWIGYSEKITVGYLEHKVTVIQREESERVVTQVLITPKGLARLSKLFNSAQDAA